MSKSVAYRARTTVVIAAALLAEAFVAHAQTVREQMHAAAPDSRNASFGNFLHRHGKSCTVNESAFGAQVRIKRIDGDLWSVRCTEGYAFAIFIGTDTNSTSWFMPCASVERMSNLRCFERLPGKVVFK